MNTKFIFVRHGQAEGNLHDIALGTIESPLTALGRKQALGCAEKLASFSPEIIYSSPLNRAVETAEIMTYYLNLGLVIDARLRERFVGARLQGKSNSEVRTLLSTEYEQLKKMPLEGKLGFQYSLAPDAETLGDAANRLLDFMSEIGVKNSSKCVACVTHAAVLAALFALDEAFPFKGHFGTDTIGNAALLEVDYDNVKKKYNFRYERRARSISRRRQRE